MDKGSHGAFTREDKFCAGTGSVGGFSADEASSAHSGYLS